MARAIPVISSPPRVREGPDPLAERNSSLCDGSDKENSLRRQKRSMINADVSAANRAKRRRTDNGESNDARRESSAEPADLDSGIGGISTQLESQIKSVRFYDPAQDETQRRQLKVRGRNLEREVASNRDQYMQAGSDGIKEAVRKADSIFRDVKQTSEATLDGRLLVNLSDMAHKRASRLVLNDTANGIDIDDFVSKCISFMRRAPDRQSASSSRRRATRADDDDGDESDQVLDWASLGSNICLPHNLRPAVPGFLLGPLSVQKKVRTATLRRARLNTQHEKETRPEALTADDMQTTSDNSVRAVCAKIKAQLRDHSQRAIAAVESALDDTASEEQVDSTMRSKRITSSGGPGLFDFVINPHDFGQTVENLFYVSFLIKEGEVGIEEDSAGMPSIVVNEESVQAARDRNLARSQAVFGLDFQTWKDLIEAFDIVEPLIPDRGAESNRSQVGRRGWYA